MLTNPALPEMSHPLRLGSPLENRQGAKDARRQT